MALVPISIENDNGDHGGDDLVHIDALPYVDSFPEDYESYALSLIEAEMGSADMPPFDPNRLLSRLRHNYQADKPRNLGPITTKEYQMLVERQGQERPPNEHIKVILASERSSQDPIMAARIEWETQRLRQINLELQQIYETGQWKLHISQLTQKDALAKDKLESLKRKVDQINAERKSLQESKIGALQRHQAKYHKLVHGNFRLVHAKQQLETQIKQLENQI